MATQRRTGKAAKRPTPKAKAKHAPRAKARPAPRAKAKPAPRVKPKAAPRAVGKPAVKGKPAPRVIGKPAVKGKPAPRVIGKPAVKGTPAPRVIGKPAVKGTPGAARHRQARGQRPPVPRVIGKPAVKGKPGTVALKTGTLASRLPRKLRPVVRHAVPAPNVRPLGVLPPESRAKAHSGPAPHVNRPLTTSKPAPRPISPQGVQGVTDKDTKEFEQRLLAERTKILTEMGHLENTVLKVNPRDSAGDLSGYAFHMADAGTDAMEREKAFLFASAEGRLLMDINEALRRLYRGEYGTCEICEKPISRARLEAMPYARLCVPCKEKEEKAGRTAGQIGQ